MDKSKPKMNTNFSKSKIESNVYFFVWFREKKEVQKEKIGNFY